ncbi:hypothetical protein HK104_001430 [Borealophlyctis nickersoniae]|nr:hypothetical protein HK104_001430 [Borealophlyctis nickersoniae]
MGCGTSKDGTVPTTTTTKTTDPSNPGKAVTKEEEKAATPAAALAKSVSQALAQELTASGAEIAAAAGIGKDKKTGSHANLEFTEVKATVVQPATETQPEVLHATAEGVATVPPATTDTTTSFKTSLKSLVHGDHPPADATVTPAVEDGTEVKMKAEIDVEVVPPHGEKKEEEGKLEKGEKRHASNKSLDKGKKSPYGSKQSLKEHRELAA